MKQIFERIREDLSWFVDQQENMLMVLNCNDAEVPYVLKILEQVEGQHAADMFIAFPQAVTDAESYVQEVVASVEAQVELVNQVRAQDEEPLWPAVPEFCKAPSLSFSARIQHLITYIRQQMPVGDHHLVVSLLPVYVENHEAYARVISGLFPRNGLEPWMEKVRILVRDDRSRPFVLPMLAREPMEMVLIYDDLHLDPSSLIAAIEETALDESAPEAERMNALVQIAALDFSYKRYDESYRKWGALFEYYHREENVPMQMLSLCGAADVLKQVSKLPEAKEHYQRGLAYGADISNLPVMLNLLLGVGEVCLRQNEWEEGDAYLELAEQIARKQLISPTVCDVMERRGIAHRALGKPKEAETFWRDTVTLSTEVQYYERAESVLHHLIALYKEARMKPELRAHEQELQRVRLLRSERDQCHAEHFHQEATQ